MGLEVYWTQFAEDKLRDIFSYYKLKADTRTARRLVNGIVNTTIILGENPQMGQVEDLLSNRSEEFRYLVHKHYKVIYWINKESS